jgi:hypothetical protein
MKKVMERFNIKYISSLEECNAENDSIDVHLYKEDGRVYSFTFATPNNIYLYMESESINYFFGSPIIFVNSLTQDNIEIALTELMKPENAIWLDIYGTIQKYVAEDE